MRGFRLKCFKLEWLPQPIALGCRRQTLPGVPRFHLTACATGLATRRHAGKVRHTCCSFSEAVRKQCLCDIE
eukprot:1244745-Pleurochrysis_carterae.AAC.2